MPTEGSAANEISIEDFVKVIQLVGTTEDVQEIEGSDKLLMFTVNFGAEGVRQVLSGIKKDISHAIQMETSGFCC